MDTAVKSAGPGRTRAAVMIFFFAQGLVFSSWASRIPDLKARLGLDKGTLGLVLLALPAGQMATMYFSGRLVTRFGSRAVLRVMAAAYALQLTVIGLVQETWQLVLCLLLFGVCGNMSNLAANTQGVEAERLAQKPIMASFHGAWSAAGLAGALLGLLMKNLQIAPYPHFCFAAGWSLCTNLLFQSRLVPGGGTAASGRRGFARPDKILVQLGLIGFCSMAAEGAMFDWSGVYFDEVLKVDPGLIPLGYVCFMGLMTGGRLIGDTLIQRYGRVTMMRICGICVTAGLLLSVLLPTIVACVPGFMLVGFGVSVMVPSVYSLAGQASKQPPGQALALTAAISYFGFLMGPPLIGNIAQLTGLRVSFAVIALFGLVISLVIGRLKIVR